MTDKDPSGARGRTMAPDEEAALVLELVDSLEHGVSRRAKRVRSSLAALVDDFRARRGRGEDLGTVDAPAAQALAALEIEAADLVAKAVWKVHDRATSEIRRLHAASPEVQTLRTLADALGLYAEALEQLVDSGRLGDPALRERALALVVQARDRLPPPAAGRA